MGLRWDVTGVANHEEVCFRIAEEDDGFYGVKKGDRLLKPETDALIWLTMFTGIGWEVTEENVDEFVARVRFFEKLNGPMLHRGNESYPLPEDVIRAHVGLKTNVAPEPRVRWLLRQTGFEFKHDDPNDPTGLAEKFEEMVEEARY